MLENNEYKHIISFGAEIDQTMEFPGSRPTYITQISKDKYLSPTMRQVYLFSKGKQPESFPYLFSTVEYLDECNLLIGIQAGAPLMTILNGKKGFPTILKDYHIESSSVNQVIYSKSTDTLILVGFSLTFLHFKVTKNRYADNPGIEISLRKTFPISEIPPPGFRVYHDKARDKILVPTKFGFSVYNMNGELVKDNDKMSNLVAHSASFIFSPKLDENAMTLEQKNNPTYFKRYIVTNDDGRVRLYHSSGQLLCEYITRSNDFIFSEFLSSEFVILVSTANDVILLDVKTGKNMTIYQLAGRPKSIRLFGGKYPRLCCLVTNTYYVLKIKNPWVLFRKLSCKPVQVRRCISLSKAARIAVLTSDSFLSMFSPSLGQFLTSAGSTVSSHISNFIYDRGIIRYNSKVYETSSNEKLFFVSSDKKVLQFVEKKDSWEYESTLPIAPRIVCVGCAFEPPRLVFFCFADTGDLLVYDYEDYSPLTRILFDQKVPLFIYFHYGSGSLLMIYHNEAVFMDTKTFLITTRIRLYKKPISAAFDDDIVIFGFGDCSVEVYEIREGGWSEVSVFVCSDKIKFVNIENHVFIAVTTNNTIYFGQSAEDITTIEVPYDVHTVSLLNPNIDLLIGLDSELMAIKRDDTYPWMKPQLKCKADTDDPALEEFVILPQHDEDDHFVKAPTIINGIIPEKYSATSSAKNLPSPKPMKIETRNSRSMKQLPEVERYVILKEMERITDDAQVPFVPLERKGNIEFTIPRRVKPKPQVRASSERNNSNKNDLIGHAEEKKEESKINVNSLLDKYKKEIEKEQERQEKKARRESLKQQKLEEDLRRHKEEEEEAERLKQEQENQKKEEEEKAEEIETENEKIEETENEIEKVADEEKVEEQKAEEKDDKEEHNEEKAEKQKLEKPVNIKGLEILSNKDKVQAKNGIYRAQPRKSSMIDMNRLSNDFKNKPKNPLTQSLTKDEEGISLRVSHIKISNGSQPRFFSQSISSFNLGRSMPLQIVSESPRLNKSGTFHMRVESESDSDTEIQVQEQLSKSGPISISPKRKKVDVFTKTDDVPEEEDDENENEENSDDNEKKENKLEDKAKAVNEVLFGTPKKKNENRRVQIIENTDKPKQENENDDDALDELNAETPTKNRYPINLHVETNQEEGEEFEELKDTGFIPPSFDDTDKPQSVQSPRNFQVRPPAFSPRRSKSPPLENPPLIPHKEEIMESGRSRNPRFSRRERNNRIESRGESRGEGHLYTGRVGYGPHGKPTGDIEMAIIVQPLPKRYANPFARRYKQ